MAAQLRQLFCRIATMATYTTECGANALWEYIGVLLVRIQHLVLGKVKLSRLFVAPSKFGDVVEWLNTPLC